MATRNIKLLQNERRAQRYPTRFPGIVIVDRRPFAVEIADISRVGACVRGAGLPARGSEVVLTANGLEVVATVVWNDGATCGINFHKPIDPLAVVRSNPFVSAAAPFTRAHEMRG